jgi:hypothetical protein
VAQSLIVIALGLMPLADVIAINFSPRCSPRCLPRSG